MEYRLLSENDFDKLHKAFNSAFSDYEVKLNLSRDEFEHRLYRKLHVDLEISAGAFDGDNLIGFIVHSSNIYQGIPTAYNGGTGVLPGFRNQYIAEQLYSFLIPRIQSKYLARIILEVIESNERAIKLYEKIGFTFKRRFLCYKQINPIGIDDPVEIEEGSIDDVDFNFIDFESSFVDSEEHLNLGTEKVLLCRVNNDLAGYLIFQPKVGRISQVAVSRIYRHEHIGESLIQKAQQMSAKPLTIINIPEDEVVFDAFLQKCGFENQVNQFEMELII